MLFNLLDTAVTLIIFGFFAWRSVVGPHKWYARLAGVAWGVGTLIGAMAADKDTILALVGAVLAVAGLITMVVLISIDMMNRYKKPKKAE